MKKAYRTPQLRLSELEAENALLAGSIRVVVSVDELDNVNARDGVDEATEMYFEF